MLIAALLATGAVMRVPAQDGGVIINRPTTTPTTKPKPKPTTKPATKPTTKPATKPATTPTTTTDPKTGTTTTVVIPQPAEPATPLPPTREFDVGDGLVIAMVVVPAGTFTMGNAEGETDDQPLHKVTISVPFLLAKTEVTQKQWTAIMGSNPSRFQGDDLPVEQVTFEDVQEFIKRLNAKSSGGWRLPTEAEWEYACRAGSTTDDTLGLDATAWTQANSRGKTHPVGSKQPNAFGLYDMQGNVLEWCEDWHVPYTADDEMDPVHPSMSASKSACRIVRGGSWNDDADAAKPGYRFWLAPKNANALLGFRLARNVQE